MADTSWSPAFRGQRPPFAEGNSAAMTHGARSPRRVDPLAAERLAELLDDPATPEYLTADPSYRPALAALARAAAVVELLATHVAEQGLTADVTSPRGALESLRRWEQTAAGHRRALGLEPTSRAKLTRDLSASRYLQGLGASPLTAKLDAIDAERRELEAGDA
jgi:hypothetical protein